MGHDTRMRREADLVRRRAWGNYLGAMVLNAFVPLLPLLIELILDHAVSTTAILITAIVYLLAVAGGSESVLAMVSHVVVSVLIAVVYGAWLVSPTRLLGGESWVRWLVGAAIVAAMITQGLDRWKMHMVNNVPCFPFMEERR
jgi:hypothetical protein